MTDLHALIRRMADELDNFNHPFPHPLATEARAALAEPQGEGPTDEELANTYWTAWHEHLDRTNSVLHTVGLRAVLAHWGRPAPPPERLALQPVPVALSDRKPSEADCLVIKGNGLTLLYCWLARSILHADVQRLIWEWKLLPMTTDQMTWPWTHWMPATATCLPTTSESD